MMRAALFDSNVLIDHFSGVHQATIELGYFDDAAISAVTWSELMVRFYATRAVGLITQDEFVDSKDFLESFEVIQISPNILDHASIIRAHCLTNTGPKLKLPDAVIKATSEINGRLLVSRNFNDFPLGPNVRIPYRLHTNITVKVLTPPAEVIYTVTDIAPSP